MAKRVGVLRFWWRRSNETSSLNIQKRRSMIRLDHIRNNPTVNFSKPFLNEFISLIENRSMPFTRAMAIH